MDMTNQCICINLRRVAQSVTQYYNALLAPSGLKYPQFPLLDHIQQRKAVSITELAKVTGLDRMTMGKHLQLMARSDLISLSPGKDRRERIVQVTSKGRQALETAYPLWNQAQTTMSTALGKEQLETFMSLLSELETASA